ncbi:MAG: hypothetical protein Q9184_007893 [Pyrenodesmia sp. 2 TL-2023]
MADTKDAVLRQEIHLFDQRIRETAALVADDGYIYRFNAGITAAKNKAQAVLRCLTLGNTNTNTNSASLPVMRDLMRESRITGEEAESTLAAAEEHCLREEVGKLEKIREWFFLREAIRMWWPADVLAAPMPGLQKKKKVETVVWIDRYDSGFW